MSISVHKIIQCHRGTQLLYPILYRVILRPLKNLLGSNRRVPKQISCGALKRGYNVSVERGRQIGERPSSLEILSEPVHC